MTFVCTARARDRTWNWLKFVLGALTGGAILVPIGVGVAIVRYFPDWYSIRADIQPLIWMVPYMAVSGIFAAFSPNYKSAVLSGFAILLVQAILDFLIWLPFHCVY